jgi:hypothetical protein
MTKSGYTVTTQGEVGLEAAGTVLNLLGVKAGADQNVDVLSWWIDFDSVSAVDKPVRVGLYTCTFATNPPGTNSTSVVVKQKYGRVAGNGFTAAKTWTVAPTVIDTEPLDEFSLDANKGLYRYDWPLGSTPDSPLAQGFVIRTLVETGDTTSAVARAGLKFERG